MKKNDKNRDAAETLADELNRALKCTNCVFYKQDLDSMLDFNKQLRAQIARANQLERELEKQIQEQQQQQREGNNAEESEFGTVNIKGKQPQRNRYQRKKQPKGNVLPIVSSSPPLRLSSLPPVFVVCCSLGNPGCQEEEDRATMTRCFRRRNGHRGGWQCRGGHSGSFCASASAFLSRQSLTNNTNGNTAHQLNNIKTEGEEASAAQIVFVEQQQLLFQQLQQHQNLQQQQSNKDRGGDCSGPHFSSSLSLKDHSLSHDSLITISEECAADGVEVEENDDTTNRAVLLQCEWGDCTAHLDDPDVYATHVKQHVAAGQNLTTTTTNFHCCWRSCKRKHPFKALYMLDAHVRKHSGEKPYACDHINAEDGTPCPKRYSRLENKRSHMRKHNGERPYVCAVCQRPFSNASDKAKHEKRTHSNIKDYKCPIKDCSKAYTDPSSLRKHVNNEHGGVSVWAYVKRIKEENGDYGIIGVDPITGVPFVIEKHVKQLKKKRRKIHDSVGGGGGKDPPGFSSVMTIKEEEEDGTGGAGDDSGEEGRGGCFIQMSSNGQHNNAQNHHDKEDVDVGGTSFIIDDKKCSAAQLQQRTFGGSKPEQSYHFFHRQHSST